MYKFHSDRLKDVDQFLTEVGFVEEYQPGFWLFDNGTQDSGYDNESEVSFVINTHDDTAYISITQEFEKYELNDLLGNEVDMTITITADQATLIAELLDAGLISIND